MKPGNCLLRYVLAAALALVAGCPPKAGRSPAYGRWGITRPLADESAEERLAAAYALLYDLKFDDARAAYEKLAGEFPNSAEAHLGLSMALRYSGALDLAMAEVKKALELDPDAVGSRLDYGDLVAPHRGVKLPDMTSEQRVARSNEVMLAASRSPHPLSAYAHTQLWVNYLVAGELDKSRRQLVELGRRRYFPDLLTDLAHNMMVALEPDAILFTNGDNDTYPLLVLQEYEKFRPDVRVVNLSLLNVPAVCRLLRDSLGVPISWDDARLETFQPRRDSARGVWLLANEMVADIIRNCEAQRRPVYFAATVALQPRSDFLSRQVLEGLAWRIADHPTGDSVDLARVIENMTGKYRLDAVGRPVSWPANLSPLTRHVAGLGVNYAVMYRLMAEHYREVGETGKAVDCYRDMLRTLEPTGNREHIGMALDLWQELSPDDPEAKALREKYPAE